MKQWQAPSKQLIDGVVVKQRKVIPDNRGRLGEILRCDEDQFKKFGQVYFTTGYPGVVKAFHLHKVAWDYWYVVHGMIQLVLFDERDSSLTKGVLNVFHIGEHNPSSVLIPPYVIHGFKTVSEHEAIIINVPSEPYNYKDPDEFRTEPHGYVPHDWNRVDG
jgi:dTDP-4-dehydrorhamnose 3,5-epimerase